MKAFKITNTKECMSKLLASAAFDDFLMLETKLTMANYYEIDGHVQHEFYSTEEWEDKEIVPYELSRWSDMRATVFSLIKGTHTPVKFQIGLQLKPEKRDELLQGLSHMIQALVLNIRYEEGKVLMITGADYKGFTLDKTAEKAFDDYITNFLTLQQIDFELDV